MTSLESGDRRPFTIALSGTAPAGMTDADLTRLVRKLLEVGQYDAAESAGEPGDSGDAAAASSIELDPPTLPPTVTVVVRSNCAPVIDEILSNAAGVSVVFLDADVESSATEGVLHMASEDAWLWVGKYEADVQPERVHDITAEIAWAQHAGT